MREGPVGIEWAVGSDGVVGIGRAVGGSGVVGIEGAVGGEVVAIEGAEWWDGFMGGVGAVGEH